MAKSHMRMRLLSFAILVCFIKLGSSFYSLSWGRIKTTRYADVHLHTHKKVRSHTRKGMVLKSDERRENQEIKNNVPEVKGVMYDSCDGDIDGEDDWGEQTEEELFEYLKEVFEILTAKCDKEKLSLDTFLTWDGKRTQNQCFVSTAQRALYLRMSPFIHLLFFFISQNAKI